MERIEELFGGSLPQGSVLLTAALFVAASLAVCFVILRILRGAFVRRDGFDPALLRKARLPVFGFAVVLALRLAGAATALGDQGPDWIRHLFNLLLIFFTAWLMIRSLTIAGAVMLSFYELEEADNLQARRVYTRLRIVERVLKFLVVLLATGVALLTFEPIRQVGISLLASAGVVGIIVGFAAQRALGTLVAGLQIAFTQPIRIDDVVIVEGEWGRIEEITLTYVVVVIWDQRRLIVPTTYFIENTFENWTRVSADILGTVFLHTDYSVDFEALRKRFLELAQNHELWDGRVAVMQVTDSTEKTARVRFLVSAEDSGTAWDLRVDLREKLIRWLQENHPGALPRFRVEGARPGPEGTAEAAA